MRPSTWVAALAAGAASAAFLAAPAYAVAGTCTVNGTSQTSSTITGTAGNDTITCTDGLDFGVTINAGAGADTITVTRPNASFIRDVSLGTINAGPGPDSITVKAEIQNSSANAGVINAGDGNDTVALTAFDSSGLANSHFGSGPDSGLVEAGGGDDRVTLTIDDDVRPHSIASPYANVGTINGGDGSDTIETVIAPDVNCQGNAGTINGGDGLLDTITLTAGGPGIFNVSVANSGIINEAGQGGGIDHITLTGGDLTDFAPVISPNSGPANTGTVNGGDAADIITLTGGNSSPGLSAGGGPANGFPVGAGPSIVNGGNGIDVINLNGGNTAEPASGAPANMGTVNGGNLIDIMTFTGGTDSQGARGTGNDSTGTINGDGDGTPGGIVDGGACVINTLNQGTVNNCTIQAG